MKAATIERFGQTPELTDVPDPVAGPGQRIAKVRAAAIKNIERMLAAGEHYGSSRAPMPMRVGLDAVVEVDGELFYGAATAPQGAFAERITVDPSQLVPLPSLDPAVAAAVPNAALSAWFGLELAGQIEPGANVLVLGATGVTGGLAVQLAKQRFNAGRVVACGRDQESLTRLRSRGADELVTIPDRPGSDFQEGIREYHRQTPLDLVLDFLWGPPAQQVLQALANDGLDAEFHRTRYVQIGEMAGATIDLPASVLRSAGVELVGQGAGSVPKEAFTDVFTTVLPEIFDLVATGSLILDVVTRPLTEISAAWEEELPSGTRAVILP